MKLSARSLACAAQCRQLGLSLIELMIAITLGMLIVAAVLALYLNISSANNELTKVNSQIENGRFAMQLLENDVVHAGFWGPYVPQFDDLTFTAVPTDAPAAVPNPCAASTSWSAADKSNLIGISVQSYGTAPCGFSNQEANTDALVVRHAEACVPGVGNCEADTAGNLYFQASLCSDTAVDPAATPYVLNTAGYVLHNRDCATVADKRKFVSNIYYVRDYAVTPGDGIPTLMRSSFDVSGAQATQPLIEGIDGFRVELGIDNKVTRCGLNTNVDYAQANIPANRVNPATCALDADNSKNTLPKYRGDGIPDGAYVHCTVPGAAPCTVADLTNVTVVKIYVLARASQSTPSYQDTKTYTLGGTTIGPFNDNFKRHVFSTTVRLTNISGRRETP